MRLGRGHFEKSNVKTSEQTPLLRLAEDLLISILYTAHPNSSRKTEPTEPVPEKMSHKTGCVRESVRGDDVDA